MKAEELRLGNFGLRIQPNGQRLFDRLEDFDDAYSFAGESEPIPLTPEILEKAGFELFPWGWVKKASNGFGIRLNVQSFSYDVSGNNPVKLQYLHQLQNLYYALTGEELPINLKA